MPTRIVLLLCGLLAFGLAPSAGAQPALPTKTEAETIVAPLEPVFFGGLRTSAATDFNIQNDYVVVTNFTGDAQLRTGERLRFDLCNGYILPDSNVKVVDAFTIVRTRMGSLRVTLGDRSRYISNFTITNVVHRPEGGDWKIAYEHVTVWPLTQKDSESSGQTCDVRRRDQ